MLGLEKISRRPWRRLPVPISIHVPGLKIGREDTVVDVGCGQGDVCVYAGRRGAAVVGIDICPQAVGQADSAMSKVPARSWRPIISDCDPIPLPGGCATVVICTEVLEHVDDPGRFLAELVRLGAPGAQYVISVPDPASEAVMRSVAPGWYWKPPFHSRVLSHQVLDDLVREAGLETVERVSRGFHQSIWWTIRFAIGANVGEPTPDHPALRHWDATWMALLASPGGREASRALDTAIPKSQLLLARKADRVDQPVPPPASVFRQPRAFASRERRLRAGSLSLGGYEFRWSVRRSGAD